MMRLTKFNPETGLYEYHEPAKTQTEYNAQRKAVIQRLGEFEDRAEGEWIVTDADDGMCENYAGFIEFKCSKCGCDFGFENGQYDWYYGDPITWKACPMCGARMKGADDEQR